MRLPLSEVIRKYIPVQRKGKEFQALCPFHNEKTPSFTINDEKEFYHCFGCGAHGSIFDFVMDHQNMSFPEAVEHLASLANMQVPQMTPAQQQRHEERKSLFDVTETVTTYFTDNLFAPVGQDVREYLRKRGLKKSAVNKFRLGYAPDSKSRLKAYGQEHDIGEQQLVDTGMLIKTDDRSTYDRFRGRLMFPIEDARGRVIAYGGRLLDANTKAAKYLNSPETDLFHKGRTLYNIKNAKAARQNHILVVEGYMDVIALDQAGFQNAVAPLGTALTQDQIQLLWQSTDSIVVCFDGDNAGLRAAARCVETVLPILSSGKEMKFIHLPTGEDPDTYVQKEGQEAFQNMIHSAQALHEKIVELEMAKRPLNTPEAKADFYNRLKAITKTIQDPMLSSMYYSSLKEKAGKILYKKRPFTKKGEAPSAFMDGSGTKTLKDLELNCKALLAALHLHPQILDHAWEYLGGITFTNNVLHDIQQKFIDAHLNGTALEFSDHETSILKNPTLKTMFPMLDQDLTAVEDWWYETAQALIDKEKTAVGPTVPTDLDGGKLEDWWKEYSRTLSAEAP